MDKHTLIGFLLIIGIMVGFSYLNRPSEEELERQRQIQDSIRTEQAERQAIAEAELKAAESQQIQQLTDSVSNDLSVKKLGDFAQFAQGEYKGFILENDLIKVTVSNKGGCVQSVEVKDYTTSNGKPLILFDDTDSEQNMTLVTTNNRVIDTKDLYFHASYVNDSTLEMSLPMDSGAFVLTYTLPQGSYMLDFNIKANNMSAYLSQRENGLDMEWDMMIRQQERGRKFENRYSGLYYKFVEDDVENLETEKDDSQKLTNRVKWIGFKDQFFSSIIIAGGESFFSSTDLESSMLSDVADNNGTRYLKHCNSHMVVNFDPTGAESTELQYFFGPNQYKTLKAIDEGKDGVDELQLVDILPLGWGIFGWVNKYLIIPIFNFLGRFLVSYGLIIFLLTLIIKVILLPFTFKSYMSTAKMRVLRPQIDEITSKIPEDKAMERQQATMSLYRSAGVSPMGGCLPMLLQMPILFAMFTFFPACIELRQQGFLWADDLSTYDSIFSWDSYIPIISSIYGNHVSLFCLLMCITNIVYTHITMRDQPGNNQMPAMKWMMYLMPVMFLFIFNDYAAGLSYYYLVSLLITIGQTYLFRLFVDDKKVLAKLEENKKKPKKKSGFMERLEKMQKEQMAQQRAMAKKRGK